jgi:hypothetical protein
MNLVLDGPRCSPPLFHQQPGRPSFGAWASYGLGSENSNLPAFVALLSRGSAARPADPLYARLAVVLAGVIDEQYRETGDSQTFPVCLKGTTEPLSNQGFVSPMGLGGIELPQVMRLAVDPDSSQSGGLVKCVLRWSLRHVCGPQFLGSETGSKLVSRRTAETQQVSASCGTTITYRRNSESGRHDLNVRPPAPKNQSRTAGFRRNSCVSPRFVHCLPSLVKYHTVSKTLRK